MDQTQRHANAVDWRNGHGGITMSSSQDESQEKGTQGYVPQDMDNAFVTGASSPRKPMAPKLGLVGTGRFIWRQLTSMRVALLLLMLLAVAAVPGSMFPQRPQDPVATAQYILDNPKLGPVLDTLGFFDVYASPWFSAIYILLFISLIGCILPRVKAHFKALRSTPVRVPRRFTRFPAQAQVTLDGADMADVVAFAQAQLRGKLRFLPRFRTVVDQEPGGMTTISAERGYLRETGNLVFHIALLGILLSFGAGQMLEYRGQAIITEGRGFANAQVAYDTFTAGAWFQEDSLEPFTLELDEFVSSFRIHDSKALDFSAHVTLTEPSGTSRQEVIKVNEPLIQNGAKVYLMGNGFAPVVTVKDADGQVAFSGAVPFLPEDDFYTSTGVIKVPDVSVGEQMGFVGYFLPTADFSTGSAGSLYPEALNPYLILDLYVGDLGLDSGIPQNVYRLKTEDMTMVNIQDGVRRPMVIEMGKEFQLPDGLGSIEFHETPRFAAFDLRYDPTLMALLITSVLAFGGVAVSLFTPRRRVWMRATPTESGIKVEFAGLARGDDYGLQPEVDRVLEALSGQPGAARVKKAPRSREI